MKGQTIVEVAVALGIGVVILTASTLIIITSLTNSQQGAAVNSGTDTAQSGLEIVRHTRDSDFAAFSALSGNYCLADTCSVVTAQSGSCGPKNSTCGANVASKFSREVAISQNDSSCKPSTPIAGARYTKATLTVAWTDSKCANPSTNCHSLKVESCLSNYTARPTP